MCFKKRKQVLNMNTSLRSKIKQGSGFLLLNCLNHFYLCHHFFFMYLLVGYFPAGTCSLSHVCSQHCQDFICHVLTVDVFKVLCPQRQESNSVLLFESPDEQMWAERKKNAEKIKTKHQLIGKRRRSSISFIH